MADFPELIEYQGVTVQSNLDSAKTGVVNTEAELEASEQNYDASKATLQVTSLSFS